MNPRESDREERGRTGNAGFTILEIMIAVAILVIGLLGILALFPPAIFSAKSSIQDTTAVLIAKSVEQAIREGIAHRRGQSADGKWNHFLFQFDGVKDPLPRRLSDANPGSDYYILLPETSTDDVKTAFPRRDLYQQGQVFIFPETDGREWDLVADDGFAQRVADESSSSPPNGGGNPTNADDDGDDPEQTGTELGPGEYLVYQTYQVGDSLIPDGESYATYAGSLPRDRKEALTETRNYSFAFAIRRAFNDASQGQHHPISLPQPGDSDRVQNKIVPGNELFEVVVLVYRSFRPGTKNAIPVYTSTFLVSK